MEENLKILLFLKNFEIKRKNIVVRYFINVKKEINNFLTKFMFTYKNS